LSDAARSGKPSKYTAETEKRLLALLDQPPPKGCSQWDGPLLARLSRFAPRNRHI